MTDFVYEVECDETAVSAVIKCASEAALKHVNAEGSICFVVTDDDSIWKMNREYRSVDRATDVLSFPSNEGFELMGIPDGFLGDIVISLDKAKAQAEEYGHSLERELSFLAVHGTLHLLGYDHMEEAQAKEMFAMQDKILFSMGVTR